jgi:hypothetical protein
MLELIPDSRYSFFKECDILQVIDSFFKECDILQVIDSFFRECDILQGIDSFFKECDILQVIVSFFKECDILQVNEALKAFTLYISRSLCLGSLGDSSPTDVQKHHNLRSRVPLDPVHHLIYPPENLVPTACLKGIVATVVFPSCRLGSRVTLCQS